MASSSRLFQLVYISLAMAPFSRAQLEELLRVSRQNNARRGVTGMLLHDGGTFIQALEGGEPEVRALYERIARDPRHHGVQVLSGADVASRSFGEWTMAFVDDESSGVRELDGYREFFGQRAASSFWQNPSRATDLLRQFRDLPFRQLLTDARTR